MSESLLPPRVQTRKVPIRDRAFNTGNITGINSYHANRMLLEQRLAEGGYHIHETAHFLLCLRAQDPKVIVVHWFAPEEIDADIGHYFMQELKPLGVLEDSQDFGEVFSAVVCSLFPHEPQLALHLYATNTLRQYHHLLTTAADHPLHNSPIEVFATLYKRVCQMLVGETFLDAGCSYGFLPLVIAERFPSLSRVVGMDILTSPFKVMHTIAEERQLKNVQFTQADLLSDDLSVLDSFDTVTALHVLEHFTESDMYRVLTNLLKVVSKQLILAVPYEPTEPERAYGHEQVFTRAKLETIGEWCIQQLGGAAKMQYEDCAGGLLLIERYSSLPSLSPASVSPPITSQPPKHPVVL